MKHFFLFIAIIAVGLAFVGMFFVFFRFENEPIDSDEVYQVEEESEVSVFDRVNVLFSLNVHDWAYPEESAEVVRRVIELHEEYEVPIEVYVTDPVFQLYVEDDLDLVELMRTASTVSVSYHVRAPAPYSGSFDWLGLSEMTAKEQERVYLEYEEQALDLVTGEPTDQPGGYQYLKDTIGYAPRMVGVVEVFDQSIGGSILAGVYQEKGAQFFVSNNKSVKPGDTSLGLWLRPQDYDLKLYEYATRGQLDPEKIFTEVVKDRMDEEVFTIGVKYHENNFYHDENPWFPVFWEEYRQKIGVISPPYDLSMALDNFRTDEEIAEHWQLYEASLEYIAAHPDEYRALNAIGLVEEFEL